MIYYNRYPMDWKRDTAGLSLAENGAYSVLIDQYYASDGNLPCDQESLWRICGAVSDEEKTAVLKVASLYFKNGDGRLRNKRADAEIWLGTQRAKIARKNGEKGGRPPTIKDAPLLDEKPAGFPVGSQNITQEKAIHRSSVIGQDQREERESPAPSAPAPPPANKWQKPSLDEVTAWFSSKGHPREAERFYAYYESNGWKVGKNKMQKWKAAGASWLLRDRQ